MKRFAALCFPALVMAVMVNGTAPVLHAAQARIGDELANRWATAAAGEYIQVLAILHERVDIQRDLPQLVYGRNSLKARHALMVSRLQDLAERTQRDLRPFLAAAERDGRARAVHFYWLDNMVGLLATPELLAQLAERSEIERIEFLPDITPIQPEYSEAAVSVLPATHQPNLDVIGAPALWAQGITGKGRLICGIDTGVRGTHRSLASRWRGNHVPTSYAWLDPRGLAPLPLDIGTQSPSHGTHTMGTAIGADTVTFDTIGVAPGAEWIAAFGVGSAALNTLDLIYCLQWAADPDGDPNTTADVPDVLNCSWGFSSVGIIYPCNDIFDAPITNLEAAGVIVIWAAGNEGVYGTSTIRYPGNKVNAFGTNFTVGNFDPSTDSIFGSSSLGPTLCAGDSIKPEVVAPGVDIVSAFRANDSAYSPLTGTSMAAPHVSGAALLLRELAPNATPQQIKHALFVSAIDKGPAGEDNTYGKGLINIPAAADSLLASLSADSIDLRVDVISVTDNNNDTLAAGDTVSLLLGLENRGGISALNTYLKITTGDPDVTPIVDSVNVGAVLAGDTANALAPLTFEIVPGTPDGNRLDITLELAATGYSATRSLTYYTAPEPVEALYTHDNTVVQFTVTNFGLYGVSNTSYYPLGGAGFIMDPSPVNHLVDGALVMGVGPDQVSDAARRGGGSGSGYQTDDHDFRVLQGGALRSVPTIDIEIDNSYSLFDDSNAENPIGVKITQRSLVYDRGVNEAFVLLIYTLENTSAGPITGLRVGMVNDWDFPNLYAGRDTTGFDAANNIGFMWDTADSLGSYRGVAVLSPGGATAFRSVNTAGSWYTSDGVLEITLTDSMKWGYLSGGIGPSSDSTYIFGDLACFIGTGPINLAGPGDTAQIAFAYVGSESGRDTLLLNTQAAQARYDIITQGNSITDPITPRAFRLHQNYPNPFNPETRIDLTLDRPGHTRIDIYNLLGRQVTTLVDQPLPAGDHRFRWDGRDRDGRAVASGVYFYRLKFGSFTQTRKMLLLR